MAAVLEVGVAACRALPVASSGSSAMGLASPLRLQGCSGSSFPVCRGLRIGLRSRSRPAAVGGTSQSSQRSVGVVAEAQETVTGAAGIVSDQTFQKLVLESDIPVLVDFWAPWCGPCRMIAPVIDELARHYAGKIKCLKLNTDESPHVATEYGIRSIPTVMIFKRGEKKDTVIGAVPKSTLTVTIEKYLDW